MATSSSLIVNSIRSLLIPPEMQEAILFYLKLGYWPNFRAPRSFNEKLNHRKLFIRDPQISLLSDKFAVRSYVEDKLGPGHLPELLFVDDFISAEQLLELGDSIVAKPNHDSKSTELIHKNSPQIAAAAAKRLNRKVKIDFGRETNQFFYSEIPRKIVVEKMLIDPDHLVPNDYKVFCFKQPDGSQKKFIAVHRDRDLPDYAISWYDQSGEYISRRGKNFRSLPFPVPDLWDRILECSDILSADFDHVRVDFYCLEGQLYLGELSFCTGGGRSNYSREGGEKNDFDFEIGEFWHMDLTHSSVQ